MARCMAWASCKSAKIELNTKDNTLMIRSTDSEYILSAHVLNIMIILKMTCRMVKAF